jgi:collagen type III alpha
VAGGRAGPAADGAEGADGASGGGRKGRDGAGTAGPVGAGMAGIDGVGPKGACGADCIGGANGMGCGVRTACGVWTACVDASGIARRCTAGRPAGCGPVPGRPAGGWGRTGAGRAGAPGACGTLPGRRPTGPAGEGVEGGRAGPPVAPAAGDGSTGRRCTAGRPGDGIAGPPDDGAAAPGVGPDRPGSDGEPPAGRPREDAAGPERPVTPVADDGVAAPGGVAVPGAAVGAVRRSGTAVGAALRCTATGPGVTVGAEARGRAEASGSERGARSVTGAGRPSDGAPKSAGAGVVVPRGAVAGPAAGRDSGCPVRLSAAAGCGTDAVPGPVRRPSAAADAAGPGRRAGLVADPVVPVGRAGDAGARCTVTTGSAAWPPVRPESGDTAPRRTGTTGTAVAGDAPAGAGRCAGRAGPAAVAGPPVFSPAARARGSVCCPGAATARCTAAGRPAASAPAGRPVLVPAPVSVRAAEPGAVGASASGTPLPDAGPRCAAPGPGRAAEPGTGPPDTERWTGSWPDAAEEDVAVEGAAVDGVAVEGVVPGCAGARLPVPAAGAGGVPRPVPAGAGPLEADRCTGAALAGVAGAGDGVDGSGPGTGVPSSGRLRRGPPGSAPPVADRDGEGAGVPADGVPSPVRSGAAADFRCTGTVPPADCRWRGRVLVGAAEGVTGAAGAGTSGEGADAGTGRVPLCGAGAVGVPEVADGAGATGVPEFAEPAVGSTRRWTAGAVVRPVGRAARTADGARGATRVPAGRVTGRAPGPEAPVPVAPVQGVSVGSGSAVGAGEARGRVSAGRPSSGPFAGAAGTVRAPLTRPPGAASRTACDSGPANEGFCQVRSEAPNPASLTGAGVGVAATRWIGGSTDQPAASRAGGAWSAAGVCDTASGPPSTVDAGVSTVAVAAPPAVSGRPRSLSRSPISPPPLD